MDKEKKYDELIQEIKALYLESVYLLAYAEAKNYGGSSIYECEETNYAYGFDAATGWLSHHVVITREEYNEAEKAGRIEARGEEEDEEDGNNENKEG